MKMSVFVALCAEASKVRATGTEYRIVFKRRVKMLKDAQRTYVKPTTGTEVFFKLTDALGVVKSICAEKGFCMDADFAMRVQEQYGYRVDEASVYMQALEAKGYVLKDKNTYVLAP